MMELFVSTLYLNIQIMGNTPSSQFQQCQSSAIRDLAKDSTISTLVCSGEAFSAKKGMTRCDKTTSTIDLAIFDEKLNNCRLAEANRQISAKGGTTA